jgi:hypothetical protein
MDYENCYDICVCDISNDAEGISSDNKCYRDAPYLPTLSEGEGKVTCQMIEVVEAARMMMTIVLTRRRQ